jgi:hypothetical protein
MAGASAGFGKTTRGVAIIFVCFDHTETKGEVKKEKEKGILKKKKKKDLFVLLKGKSVRNKKTEDLKAFYGKFKSSSLYPHFFSSRQSESQQSTTKQLPVLLNRCLVSAPCRAALLF